MSLCSPTYSTRRKLVGSDCVINSFPRSHTVPENYGVSLSAATGVLLRSRTARTKAWRTVAFLLPATGIGYLAGFQPRRTPTVRVPPVPWRNGFLFSGRPDVGPRSRDWRTMRRLGWWVSQASHIIPNHLHVGSLREADRDHLSTADRRTLARFVAAIESEGRRE